MLTVMGFTSSLFNYFGQLSEGARSKCPLNVYYTGNLPIKQSKLRRGRKFVCNLYVEGEGGELLIGTESKVVQVDGGVVYRVMAC